MNEFAYRHKERLHFAARRLARDVRAMRADHSLPKLYRELYEFLQARLSAVTQARQEFGRWLREHPDASTPQVRRALRNLNIPVTQPALRSAIREIHKNVRQQIRQEGACQ